MKIKLDDLQIEHIVAKELKNLYIMYIEEENDEVLLEAIEVLLQYYMVQKDALRFILEHRHGHKVKKLPD